MAAYYKERNKSLLDVIEDLFKEFGYYSNDVISIVLEGLDGQERISRIMSKVRNNPIKELCGLKVKTIVDYQKDETGLPKSNVLKYYLEDNSWFALRPSGTEPKIKLYINAIGESSSKSQEKLKGINDFMQEVINSIE